MKINNIDDAIEFITQWRGTPGAWPGGAGPLHQSEPKALRVLDEKLGQFWGEPPYPFLPSESDHNTERGLFRVQDTIINPRNASMDDDVTLLVAENQGVWFFGRTNEQKLLIKGDWIWSSEALSYAEWSPFDADIQDVLVFTLLLNFFFYTFSLTSNNTQPIYDSKDLHDNYVLLWSHPAWSAFDGFYTDKDETTFVFSGFGAIQRG